MRRTKSALICWCVAFPAYLLTAGGASVHELATGGVFAAGAALFADLLARASSINFDLPDGSLRRSLTAIASLPRASARTGGALWRVALTGRSWANTSAVPFDYGARDDPSARTRRAVALLLATLAPDRFVIRMEADGTLLHRVVSANEATDPEWLT